MIDLLLSSTYPIPDVPHQERPRSRLRRGANSDYYFQDAGQVGREPANSNYYLVGGV